MTFYRTRHKRILCSD